MNGDSWWLATIARHINRHSSKAPSRSRRSGSAGVRARHQTSRADGRHDAGVPAEALSAVSSRATTTR